MVRRHEEKLPTLRPGWMTYAFIALALAVLVLFVWGMILAGSPR